MKFIMNQHSYHSNNSIPSSTSQPRTCFRHLFQPLTYTNILIFMNLIQWSYCMELTEIQSLTEPRQAVKKVVANDDFSIIFASCFDHYAYIYKKIDVLILYARKSLLFSPCPFWL